MVKITSRSDMSRDLQLTPKAVTPLCSSPALRAVLRKYSLEVYCTHVKQNYIYYPRSRLYLAAVGIELLTRQVIPLLDISRMTV